MGTESTDVVLGFGTGRAWWSVEYTWEHRADECGSWVPHRAHLRAGAPGVLAPQEWRTRVSELWGPGLI